MKSSAGAFDGVFNGVVQISCFKGMLGVVVSVLRLGDDGLLIKRQKAVEPRLNVYKIC